MKWPAIPVCAIACVVSVSGTQTFHAQESQEDDAPAALLVQPGEVEIAANTPAQVQPEFPLGETPDTVFLSLNLLYSASEFGRRVIRESDQALIRFIEENESFVRSLEEEEYWLTELRNAGAVSDSEFDIIDAVFDGKVISRRVRQDRIPRLLLEWINQNQGEFTVFIERSLPEIARRERFNVVLNSSASLFHLPGVDITNLMLEEVNRNLGDGTQSLNYEPPEQYVLRNAPVI